MAETGSTSVEFGNLAAILLCKLDSQKPKILLGNRIYQIQHPRIMLKSLVPNFYPKMPLTFTFFRNPTSLLQTHPLTNSPPDYTKFPPAKLPPNKVAP